MSYFSFPLNHQSVFSVVQIISLIHKSGNIIALTVVHQASDQFLVQRDPFMIDLKSNNGGFGLYLSRDHDGFFAQKVGAGSSADAAGQF